MNNNQLKIVGLIYMFLFFVGLTIGLIFVIDFYSDTTAGIAIIASSLFYGLLSTWLLINSKNK
jgi:hypothetical protein